MSVPPADPDPSHDLDPGATPTTRFSGLAEGYDRHRPDYPAELLGHIADACDGALPKMAVDVGAGTGIATRLISAALPDDWRVIGVEPNADMRGQAEAREARESRISYQAGEAENLAFDTGAAGLVTVAQAIHWFDRPAFFSTVGRVLAPNGALAVLYNDRDLETGLAGAFETLMESEIPGYDRYYRQGRTIDDQDGELAALEWVAEVTSHRVTRDMIMPPADFAGLMLSRSKLKPYRQKFGADEASRRLTALAADHANDADMVTLGLTSRVHIAKRR